MTATLIAVLHFLLAFGLVAVLAAERALLRGPATHVPYSLVIRLDIGYGLGAMLLLGIGIFRVNHGGKGWDYYLHSGPFLTKLTLFVVIALLSIIPTMAFLRAVRGEAGLSQAALERVRGVITLELVLVSVLIVCASLAAHGVGVFS